MFTNPHEAATHAHTCILGVYQCFNILPDREATECRVFQPSIVTIHFQKAILICSASRATITLASAWRCADPSVAVSEPFRSQLS